MYDRIGLPALNEDVGRRDADSWTELGGTGGWGNEDTMYIRPCRMCGRKEFSNKKAKSTTADKKKTTVQISKIQFLERQMSNLH